MEFDERAPVVAKGFVNLLQKWSGSQTCPQVNFGREMWDKLSEVKEYNSQGVKALKSMDMFQKAFFRTMRTFSAGLRSCAGMLDNGVSPTPSTGTDTPTYENIVYQLVTGLEQMATDVDS